METVLRWQRRVISGIVFIRRVILASGDFPGQGEGVEVLIEGIQYIMNLIF